MWETRLRPTVPKGKPVTSPLPKPPPSCPSLKANDSCYSRERGMLLNGNPVLFQSDLNFLLALVTHCRGLTLDPQALLILDDEVLLSLLQLLQLVLRVLGDQSQLLKRLVDLEVLLGHGVSKTSNWRSTLETDRGECRPQ